MSRGQRVLVGVFVVAVVMSLTAVPMFVSAQSAGAGQGLTRGEPDLSVYLPENEVQPGSETNLAFQIANDGNVYQGTAVEQVTTARGVSFEIEDGGPFEVKSGETPVGPIQDGMVGEATQRLVVPEDIDPGTYTVRVNVEYDYTNRVSAQSTQRLSESETHSVEIRVPDEPQFSVSNVESDIEPGTSGDATLEIENIGSETARNTQATIVGGGGVVIDGGTGEEFLGTLEPNESTTVAVNAAIDAAVGDDGAKPLNVEFTYEDTNGVDRTGDAESVSLAPAAEQAFSIENINETLAVGYDGEIRGTLSNDGPRPVDDAVLVIQPASESLAVDNTRFALPDLEAGETTEFRYPTEISGTADEGPRQVRFTVEYQGSDSTVLESETMSERVIVDEQRDEFSIEGISTSVEAGGSTTIALEVTNERPETLSNIDARLYADSPLSSSNDESFIDELAPGETAELEFALSAESTMAKTYPVELDFEYDTEAGESKLSDVYQQSITVQPETETDGGGPSPLVIGVLALILIGAGIGAWYLWQQR